MSANHMYENSNTYWFIKETDQNELVWTAGCRTIRWQIVIEKISWMRDKNNSTTQVWYTALKTCSFFFLRDRRNAHTNLSGRFSKPTRYSHITIWYLFDFDKSQNDFAASLYFRRIFRFELINTMDFLSVCTLLFSYHSYRIGVKN